ncbi:MAG: acyl-CoA dehydrogenase family protein [Gammaproteobacteria bacterium]|nr:acyl-CoA dehydrogenase family protein [Gammaproteobacteria bacterium]
MQDLIQIDALLTAEEKSIRDTVRHFVDTEVTPIMADCYENGHFPQALIKRFAELGLLGITLPEQLGGVGASYVAYGLVCQELERGDSALRSFVSVQSSLCMYPIFAYGSDEQRKNWLPKMAQGELIACFGLTEPDGGSNPSAMKTQAKKTKGGWLLNGTKQWITNATVADLAIVWANTEEGVRGFAVEKGFKGFSTTEIHHKMSLRASVTGSLFFTDCFVPDTHLLPGTSKGLGAALSCLTQARYGIAWGAMGAAMACFDVTLDYLGSRKVFGRPLTGFQLVQKELADSYTEICKAQLLNLQVGRLKEQGSHDPTFTSMVKMNSCEQALKIARAMRNLLGANGITLDYHVIRHMMNLESVYTYEGTDAIHHLIIGKYLTGLNAFE